MNVGPPAEARTAVTGRSTPEFAVSVVLACRNAAPFLATQLEALSRQEVGEPWELVLSDNGSTDDTLAIAERFRDRLPRLVVVDSAATRGPGAARNAGVRAATGDRLLFCDSDDEVGEGWLGALAGALREHGLVAACLEHSRLNTWPDLRKRRGATGLLQGSPPFFLPYMMTCALGVRREVHERIGGFDESYRDSGEDRDYCYRAQLGGVPLVLIPDAVVHYRYRETLVGVFAQARRYGRGHVQLYRDYRHLGMRRTPPFRAPARWLLLSVRLVPALTSRRRLLSWMSRAGWNVGRLEGSLRYRVLAP